MKRLWAFIILSGCILGTDVSIGFCGQVTAKYTLDNGMTVLVSEMPASSLVSVQALIKIGSATEGEHLGEGISHFVEHMLFKGTAKRKVGQISQEIKAMGGYINASTSFDQTIYRIDLPAEHYQSAVEIMSDMLMNSQFEAQEVEKEREVVFGEMRLRDDNPDVILNELAYKTIYTRHPYQHPIIGYKPLFEKITRDELFDFYKQYYIPNNIVLAVAGNIKADKVLPYVKEVFKDFEPKPYPVRNLPAEPPQISPRRAEAEYPTDITRMMVSFQGVSISHLDMFAMDVLAMILGQGHSSRLYRELLDRKRLVHSLYAINDTPLDQGSFEINCSLDEKNIEEVLKTVTAQIDLIKQKGVTKQEVEKAKRQVLSKYVFDRQTASDVADDLVTNEVLIGDYEFSRKYVEGIKAITAADIKAAAQKYLLESTQTTVILRPQKENPEVLTEEVQLKAQEIEKYTLDNGLRVLLREDHIFPIVTIYLALEGGLRYEDSNLNGISNLTASLWPKGTKSHNSQEIAEMVESKGTSVGGFSGQNSFGLTLHFLAEDLDFGLGLLEDLIVHPTFPEDELSKLKEQVNAAILTQEDNVVYMTSRAVRQSLFKTHPYRMDTLGTKESIAKIQREDIVQFYKDLSVPNNMVLAVYGDIDSKKVLAAIENKFAQLPKKEISLVKHQEQPLQQPIEKTQSMDKEQAVVMLGFQGPLIGSADEEGVDILTSIIGGGMNSRLFLKVREELGKAYHLSGRYVPGPDMGLIIFYAATTDADVEKVKEILKEQLVEIRDKAVSDVELTEVKTYLKGVNQMSLETNASLASVTALEELYGLGFRHYKDYNQNIDKVTKDDIQRIAGLYLDLKKAVLVITRPTLKVIDLK